jgi:hypothetical protein
LDSPNGWTDVVCLFVLLFSYDLNFPFNPPSLFKVKTTQPRRYLVRPNQGLVAPGGSETISILLVEKDKNTLLQSYDRLGQSALDHSKDKFLVQSCVVSDEFSKKYAEEKSKGVNAKELSDALTSVWNTMSSSNANQISNKKLHVKHVVPEAAPTASSAQMPKTHDTPSLDQIENMSQEQMFAEITQLRKKYDELVSFSVNLTAERDILNNTLEQTKRDLNREMAARAKLENAGGGGSGSGRSASKGGSLFGTLLPLLIVAIGTFLAGVRLTNTNQVAFLENVPYVHNFAFPDVEEEEAKAENLL